MKTKIIILFCIAIFSTNYAQVGVRTDEPTHTLDVNGDVRVRNINNLEGNSSTHKRVVADEQGVLRTINNQNPLIFGGDLSNPFNTLTLSTPGGDTNTQPIVFSSTGTNSLTFTISETSLVTFDYNIGVSISGGGAGWNDNRRKMLNNSLRFSTVPSGSVVPSGVNFAFSQTVIAGEGGRPGFFNNSGSHTLLLIPGDYTLELRCSVISEGTTNVSAQFGTSANRLTITAVPVTN